MKKTIICLAFALATVLNVVYLALIIDSFWQEYVKDNFFYWGYPQWGWMYSAPKLYFWFNVCYLGFLAAALFAGLFLVAKRRLKTGAAFLLLPLLTAVMFFYMPSYNWQRHLDMLRTEQKQEYGRLPEGKWWVSTEQMQRYYDASLWERLKGRFGRGEWPGGYALWGDYRIWLLPDFLTDTKGRRGMVLHGGTQKKSPWGIDMGDNIIDFAIQLRQNKEPTEIVVRYGSDDTAAAEVEKKQADGIKEK